MKQINFNNDWLFYKENKEESKQIDLPHDAMILEERDENAPSGSAGAFFPGGVYHYEKMFTPEKDWQNKALFLVFEGVYQNAKVYINGKCVKEHDYGYTPFQVPLDKYINYKEPNRLQVVADNSEHPNSRWYSGSGIYRSVWLYVAEQTHIDYEGVKITTIKTESPTVQVETKHNGDDVEIEILDEGKVIAKGVGDKAHITIPEGKLWSAETPQLYTCVTRLLKDGKQVDEQRTIFGIRTIFWSNQGLFINGEETLLRGGCVHHDNGILGARCYKESEERRVRIMKEAGYNALRISHNPASKAMLEACDKLGMYVMDETWDMWYGKKTAKDYSRKFEKNYLEDIKALVARDYNHPSVIMYSIGNEVTEPATDKGQKLAREMTTYIHEIDSTRAVTCGLNLWLLYNASKGKGVYSENENEEGSNKKVNKEMNSTVFNMVASKVGTRINNGAKSSKADAVITPCLDTLDIAGYNYSSGRYPLEGKLHPNRVIVGTETYPQDIYKNWEMVKRYPYLIGDFVWTSWDYLGEVGLGAWAYSKDGARFNKPYPWLLADTGTIDILGNIGAQADYAAVVWGLHQTPKIHVRPVNHSGEKPSKMVWRGTNAMPSWAWKGCEGKKAEVEVYSLGSKVCLMLDDKVVGTKRLKECKAVFKMKYQPGELTAISYGSDNKEIGRETLRSASGKSQIQLRCEKTTVTNDEIIYVDVNIVGENQVVEANDDRQLKITVTGGELLAFGSANPRTKERYQDGVFTTYYGRAQAVIKVSRPGKLVIKASGEDLETKALSL